VDAVAVRSKDFEADDASVVYEQFTGGVVFEDSDVGLIVDLGDESTADFATGCIAVCVIDAGKAVRAFAGGQECAVLAIEGGAPGDEFFNECRAFCNENLSCRTGDEAIPGVEGVGEVEGYILRAAESDGDSTLSVGGVGLGELLFGDEGDAAVACEGQRGAKASNTSS
jgi:hypothetical protein